MGYIPLISVPQIRDADAMSRYIVTWNIALYGMISPYIPIYNAVSRQTTAKQPANTTSNELRRLSIQRGHIPQQKNPLRQEEHRRGTAQVSTCAGIYSLLFQLEVCVRRMYFLLGIYPLCGLPECPASNKNEYCPGFVLRLALFVVILLSISSAQRAPTVWRAWAERSSANRTEAAEALATVAAAIYSTRNKLVLVVVPRYILCCSSS